MSKDLLLSRRQKAEADFNQLLKQREQIDIRMAQLQGQYQLLTEQLEALPKKKEKKAELIAANEIKVEEEPKNG